MTTVVVIRPSSDAVEQTLALWMDLALPPGTSLTGVTALHDLGAGTLPAAVQNSCAGADIVLYLGHATETELGDPTLLDSSTIGSARGSTLVAIACFSGVQLGLDAVNNGILKDYLGFTEPLFVYNAQPGLMGTEIAPHLRAFLEGRLTISQLRDRLEDELKTIELLYRTGYWAQTQDAIMIWMGARMNHRGLVAY